MKKLSNCSVVVRTAESGSGPTVIKPGRLSLTQKLITELDDECVTATEIVVRWTSMLTYFSWFVTVVLR